MNSKLSFCHNDVDVFSDKVEEYSFVYRENKANINFPFIFHYAH